MPTLTLRQGHARGIDLLIQIGLGSLTLHPGGFHRGAHTRDLVPGRAGAVSCHGLSRLPQPVSYLQLLWCRIWNVQGCRQISCFNLGAGAFFFFFGRRCRRMERIGHRVLEEDSGAFNLASKVMVCVCMCVGQQSRSPRKSLGLPTSPPHMHLRHFCLEALGAGRPDGHLVTLLEVAPPNLPWTTRTQASPFP